MSKTHDELWQEVRRLADIEGVEDVRLVRVDGTDCIRVRVTAPKAARRIPQTFKGLKVVLIGSEPALRSVTGAVRLSSTRPRATARIKPLRRAR